MAVNNLRLFTRRRPPEWQHFDLSEMLRTICCQLGQETVHQGLQIQQSFPQALTLYGDPLLIEKAITNLVENAMEAMPGGGTVHVSATSDAAVMDIRIQDGGRGIESHDVEHIFHPFFTTKSGALGLGLAIVRQVAETHGGIIRVARVNNGGSLISLRLPRRMTSQVA